LPRPGHNLGRFFAVKGEGGTEGDGDPAAFRPARTARQNLLQSFYPHQAVETSAATPRVTTSMKKIGMIAVTITNTQAELATS